jgi:hypothetical protein
MKKLLFPAIALSFIFSSCSNEVDVIADWKETPIIYGLLTLDSTNQYIKLYKAFLDEETSALEIAQNPDSFYYQYDVEVYLEKKSNGQRIDLVKTEIAPLDDDGDFATTPNIIYKFTETLSQNETYIFHFNNTLTGKTATSETPIVNDFLINFPPEGYDFNFTIQNPINIQWKSAKHGKVCDLVFRFTYDEWNINTPSDATTKSVEWKVAGNIVSNSTVGGEQLSARLDGASFYTSLKSLIPENSELRRRAVTRPIELLFYVGGEELYNFIRVNQAQSGITSLQTLPEYTNVTGGLGIFSSRKYKLREDLGMNNVSLDSLSCGFVTGNLNFVNRNCN